MGVVKFLIFLIAFVGLAAFVFAGFRWRRIQGGINAGNVNGVEKVPVGRFIASFFLLTVLLVFFSAIQIVPAGHRGIVFSQGSGVQQRILQEGLNFVTPAIESVTMIDVRVRKYRVELPIGKNSAASKDTQEIGAVVTIRYHYDSKQVDDIQRDIGSDEDVKAKVLDPESEDAIKKSTSTFDAEEMIANRGALGDLIKKKLAAQVKSSHVIIDSIAVNNINFDPDFAQAIEDKVKQKQIAKTEELKEKVEEHKANQVIEKAKGVREASILKGEGEAKANNLVNDSITSNLIEWRRVNRWNGEVSKVSAGGSSGMILQLPVPE